MEELYLLVHQVEYLEILVKQIFFFQAEDGIRDS